MHLWYRPSVWVRFVLGPKRFGSDSSLVRNGLGPSRPRNFGSESSWVRVVWHSSEIFFFEIVDGRRTDGRRTDDDGRRMPAYSISSPVSLRLRWAKNGGKNCASLYYIKFLPPFFIRYWALLKGVYELILSRLPTAEHTVVSTLSHFMWFLCIFELFLFYIVYLPIFIFFLSFFPLFTCKYILTLKKAKAESALSLIYSCTVNGLIPLYTYFNHFSNPLLGSSATGKIFVWCLSYFSLYIYIAVVLLILNILFFLSINFTSMMFQLGCQKKNIS